jgi:hypothetical protein
MPLRQKTETQAIWISSSGFCDGVSSGVLAQQFVVVVIEHRPWQSNLRQLWVHRFNPKIPNPWHCAVPPSCPGDGPLVLHKIERTALSDRWYHISAPFLNFYRHPLPASAPMVTKKCVGGTLAFGLMDFGVGPLLLP